MQKISTYLYPNRIQLLADLAGFITEYTNVYQRQVKIYKGVDNVIELDVKNADQKRIDISTSVDNMRVHLMDSAGNAVGVYEVGVFPQDGPKKGLAYFTITAESIAGLDNQFLKYSITHTVAGRPQVMYGDSRFGALGTMELVGDAVAVTRSERSYSSFTAEIDLNGIPTWHSTAIPCTFYEAIPTTEMAFTIDIKGLTGSVWVEATKDSTISVESFKKGDIVASFAEVSNWTGAWEPTVDIGEYKYLRVSYTTPTANGIGAQFEVTRAANQYNVTVRSGGTGYAVGSQLKVLGSVLGGVDGVNDLIISVTHVSSPSSSAVSSYSLSSVSTVTWSGSAADGTGTYVVTGKNVSGTVDKITVS